jgi:hypothetical protein
MSHLEMESIAAFGQLEMIEHELKIGGMLSSAGRIFTARMNICAYVNELKMQRVLTKKENK